LKNNYVLIDYENVQPKSLALLNGHPFTVMVFVGANQEKLPFELVASLQSLGDKAEYVKIGGNGSNALDFHIAFYIGQIAARDPDAYFHIISKDTGFDPLIRHLKDRKIYAQREKDLAEIPLLRISSATSSEEKIAAIVKNLATRGHSRPRKVATLRNTINALFTKTLDDAELTRLMELLRQKKYIVIDKDHVTYRPPITHTKETEA